MKDLAAFPSIFQTKHVPLFARYMTVFFKLKNLALFEIMQSNWKIPNLENLFYLTIAWYLSKLYCLKTYSFGTVFKRLECNCRIPVSDSAFWQPVTIPGEIWFLK